MAQGTPPPPVRKYRVTPGRKFEPILCATEASDHPKVWPLAASDAAAGLDRTATLCHTVYELSPFAHFVLPLMDGTRSRAQLIEAIYTQATDSGTTVTDASGPVTDPARLRQLSEVMLKHQLDSLIRAGLLVA